MTEIEDRRNESRFENNLKPNDRRKGPDTIIKLTFWCGLIIWIFFVLSVSFAMKADPDIRYRFFGIVSAETKDLWELKFFDYALYSSVFLLIISIINIILRAIRHKRRADKISYFSLITSFLAVVAIIIYIFMR